MTYSTIWAALAGPRGSGRGRRLTLHVKWGASMPTATELTAFIAELRDKIERDELPKEMIYVDGEPVENVAWFAQLLIDLVDELAQLPATERQQEPWLGVRRDLAREFAHLQRALR